MLYRYIFRGLGLVLAAGMIAALFLAVFSQTESLQRHDVSQPAAKVKVRP